MASTTLPTVRAAIVSALEASEGLDGVTIANGGPEPDKTLEYIWVFRSKATREFKTLGGNPVSLDEDVKTTLRIVAMSKLKSAAECEARATDILEEVESTLREDVSLNDSVQWQRIEDLEAEPVTFDGTQGYAYSAVVNAHARI